MTSNHELYGVRAASILEGVRKLESALGIRFALHESYYRLGEYFRSGDTAGEHFILQRNYDETEREWLEEVLAGIPYLLYVSGSPRAEQIREILRGVHGIERA